MIMVAFTPCLKGSREHIELKSFLHANSSKSRELIRLPEGAMEINPIEDNNGSGVKQVLKELSYYPKRAVVLDARNPDAIANTLENLTALVGTNDFCTNDISNRFFIITQNNFATMLNELVTQNNEHLRNLLAKPYFDQVAFF